MKNLINNLREFIEDYFWQIILGFWAISTITTIFLVINRGW